MRVCLVFGNCINYLKLRKCLLWWALIKACESYSCLCSLKVSRGTFCSKWLLFNYVQFWFSSPAFPLFMFSCRQLWRILYFLRRFEILLLPFSNAVDSILKDQFNLFVNSWLCFVFNSLFHLVFTLKITLSIFCVLSTECSINFRFFTYVFIMLICVIFQVVFVSLVSNL